MTAVGSRPRPAPPSPPRASARSGPARGAGTSPARPPSRRRSGSPYTRCRRRRRRSACRSSRGFSCAIAGPCALPSLTPRSRPRPRAPHPAGSRTASLEVAAQDTLRKHGLQRTRLGAPATDEVPHALDVVDKERGAPADPALRGRGAVRRVVVNVAEVCQLLRVGAPGVLQGSAGEREAPRRARVAQCDRREQDAALKFAVAAAQLEHARVSRS